MSSTPSSSSTTRFYALNGGGLPGEPGRGAYFAPDSLKRVDLEVGYSGWLHWLFTGDLASCYEEMRWEGWEADTRAPGGDQAFSTGPVLWTKGPPIGERSRRAVPVDELWDLHVAELPRQMGQRPD